MYLSELRYATPPFTKGDPDAPISDSFSVASTDLSLAFDVEAEYGLYDDARPNALALPIDVGDPGNTQSDGTVLIGRRLIAEEKSRSHYFWGASVTLFMAHEFAHIRQFKKKLGLPVQQRELHADFMAGWYLGARNRVSQGTFANIENAARSLFAKGDYKFNEVSSHGTPEQRVAALLSGYGAGLQGAGLEAAFTRGVYYVRK